MNISIRVRRRRVSIIGVIGTILLSLVVPHLSLAQPVAALTPQVTSDRSVAAIGRADPPGRIDSIQPVSTSVAHPSAIAWCTTPRVTSSSRCSSAVSSSTRMPITDCYSSSSAVSDSTSTTVPLLPRRVSCCASAACLRISFSMAPEISGCCFRNSLAFSRPWPSLVSL